MCIIVTPVLLYSETYHAEPAENVVVIPSKTRSRQFPVTTTVSRHSEPAAPARQLSASQSSSERHTDVAVKRRQIGLKRKSLQEMRHLLNTAIITVMS